MAHREVGNARTNRYQSRRRQLEVEPEQRRRTVIGVELLQLLLRLFPRSFGCRLSLHKQLKYPVTDQPKLVGP